MLPYYEAKLWKSRDATNKIFYMVKSTVQSNPSGFTPNKAIFTKSIDEITVHTNCIMHFFVQGLKRVNVNFVDIGCEHKNSTNLVENSWYIDQLFKNQFKVVFW